MQQFIALMAMAPLPHACSFTRHRQEGLMLKLFSCHEGRSNHERHSLDEEPLLLNGICSLLSRCGFPCGIAVAVYTSAEKFYDEIAISAIGSSYAILIKDGQAERSARFATSCPTPRLLLASSCDQRGFFNQLTTRRGKASNASSMFFVSSAEDPS